MYVDAPRAKDRDGGAQRLFEVVRGVVGHDLVPSIGFLLAPSVSPCYIVSLARSERFLTLGHLHARPNLQRI